MAKDVYIGTRISMAPFSVPFIQKKMKEKHLYRYLLIISAAIIFTGQILYFGWIITGSQRFQTQPQDAVLVYGGDPGRIPSGFQFAEMTKAKYLVFSINDKEASFRKEIANLRSRTGCSVRMVAGALTTDQDARLTIPVLKSLLSRSPKKRVLFITSWYHLPRAYFLTRLYSLDIPPLGVIHNIIEFFFPTINLPFGSGIEWHYCSAEPVPTGWWKRPEVRMEMVKFWGSLGRVVLASVGITNWPPVGSVRPQ